MVEGHKPTRARAHSLDLVCMRMRKVVLCTMEHVDPVPFSYDWNVSTGYWNENLAWNDLIGTSDWNVFTGTRSDLQGHRTNQIAPRHH